jgi:hypothetical protein
MAIYVGMKMYDKLAQEIFSKAAEQHSTKFFLKKYKEELNSHVSEFSYIGTFCAIW